MKNPEKIFYVPLGDKSHENLEKAGSYEAWELSRRLLIEEDAKGRIVSTGVESLQKHPLVNPVYYLRKGITAMGRYLVIVEERKISSRT